MTDEAFDHIYDNSDRTLIASTGDKRRVYRVLSHAMSNASPHWKAMLSPTSGFRESRPDVPIEFPEDDPDALVLLLDIAHLRFNKLPKLISFSVLIQLAVLCDKYDTVILVEPFIEKWTTQWLGSYLEPGYEEWLNIAWTFGCKNVFERLLRELVISTKVDEDDNCLNSQDQILGNGINPGLIQTILERREQVIPRLLELYHTITQELIADTFCHSKSHNQSLCNVIVLGLMTRAMSSGPWHQEVLATQPRVSILLLVESFEKLSSLPYTWKPSVHPRFLVCRVHERLQQSATAIIKEDAWVLDDSDIRHLEEQATKSGLGELMVEEK